MRERMGERVERERERAESETDAAGATQTIEKMEGERTREKYDPKGPVTCTAV